MNLLNLHYFKEIPCFSLQDQNRALCQKLLIRFSSTGRSLILIGLALLRYSVISSASLCLPLCCSFIHPASYFSFIDGTVLTEIKHPARCALWDTMLSIKENLLRLIGRRMSMVERGCLLVYSFLHFFLEK